MPARPPLRFVLALAAAAMSSWASPAAVAAPERAPAGDAGVIFAAHNTYRARHCAPPLAWSAEVAKVAQAWADRLARDCSFQHSGGTYGENLWAGTAGAFGPDRVVASWYDEVAKYDYQRPGFSMKTGHFTQVVWRETRALGCGTATCPVGGQGPATSSKPNHIWVCNYAPPGNVEGQFKRNVLPTSCKK